MNVIVLADLCCVNQLGIDVPGHVRILPLFIMNNDNVFKTQLFAQFNTITSILSVIS